MLTAAGLGLQFQDKTILDGIDLELAEGDCLAVVGKNGSGKAAVLDWLGKRLAVFLHGAGAHSAI